eukprot:3957383-Pyramimonas_sp.AAC.1
MGRPAKQGVGRPPVRSEVWTGLGKGIHPNCNRVGVSVDIGTTAPSMRVSVAVDRGTRVGTTIRTP